MSGTDGGGRGPIVCAPSQDHKFMTIPELLSLTPTSRATPPAPIPEPPALPSPSRDLWICGLSSRPHGARLQCCLSGCHLHGNAHHPRSGPLCSAHLSLTLLSSCPFECGGDTHAHAQAKTQCPLTCLPPPTGQSGSMWAYTGVCGGGMGVKHTNTSFESLSFCESLWHLGAASND